VGRPDDPIMLAPEPLPPADHIVTESTYGDRRHSVVDPLDELCDVVARTLGRGGTLLVPVFAVGRAQSVLFLLSELRRTGRIPVVPTYLNSPMAVETTELFLKLIGQHRLDAAQCEQMRNGVEFVRSVEESMELSARRGPMIILAASGMATGGRVLHHLEELAPNHRNTILFTGYQAAGTRGEAMVNGARQVKVFGEWVPIRAKVESLDSLSAHADADELLDWLGRSERPPDGVSVVHGEATAADTFRRRIHDELGWTAAVPSLGQTVRI
jgi:metallo-beta-lactamase family protein